MRAPAVVPGASERVPPVPIRDAATLLLARDGDAGLEVLLLRRSDAAVFVPGAHVFPGGAVDLADRAAEARSRCAGLSDEVASSLVGADGGGLALWVAAVRECFEETGILLAGRAGTDRLPPAELAVVRRDVHAGRRTFAGWLEELDLWVAADRIHYFARWLTPPGNTRRFDTRFLVAAAPPGQEAEPDGSELTEARWMTPADAATRHRAGAIDLVLPTRWALDLVGAYHSVAELLGAAGDGDLATAGIRHG